MTEKAEQKDHQRTGAPADDLDRLRAEFAALVSLLPVTLGMAGDPAAVAPLPGEDEVEEGFDNMPV